MYAGVIEDIMTHILQGKFSIVLHGNKCNYMVTEN